MTVIPELETLVRAKMETGLYVDESEVVREALRGMDCQERFEAPELEALLLEGLASGEARLWGAGLMDEVSVLVGDRKS